jgi:hypothetical protein
MLVICADSRTTIARFVMWVSPILLATKQAN